MTVSITACHKLPALCLILLGALIAATPALSAEIKITPGISERITWNDNMFLKEFDDIELRSEPSLNFTYDSQRNQLNLGGVLSNFRYADKSQYNRTTGRMHTNVGHQFSERFRANIGGGWQRDFSLDTYWDDPTTQKTMLRRDSRNSSAGFSYALTELDTVELSFSWADMEYEKRISGYADYEMLSGGVLWRHIMLDGTMALVAQGNWQRAEFDSPASGTPIILETKQDITQSTYSGMAGIYWMPTDRFTAQILAGARHTDSEVKNKSKGLLVPGGSVESTSDTSTTGFTGSADITWRYDNGSVKGAYNQEYLPSALGELRRTNNVSLSGTHNYDRRLSLLYTARYTNSKSDNVTNTPISKDYWNMTVGPRYKFTDDFSATLRYGYFYYHNKITEKKLHANSIFLQFAFELPKSF